MAPLSTLDTSSSQLLRAQLEALEGVARAVVDEGAEALWLICEPEAEHEPLNAAVQETLRSLGLDPLEVSVQMAVRLGEESARRRVRFERIERIHQEDGLIRMRVTLEWRGQRYVGDAVGEAGAAIEQRTAAAAALRAIEALVGWDVGFRLIGTKQFRAFDTDLIVASILSAGPPAQHFVGAVRVTDDPLHAATAAVFHALNRMLGNILATTD